MKGKYAKITPLMDKYLSKINFEKIKEDDYSCTYSNEEGWRVSCSGELHYYEPMIWIVAPAGNKRLTKECRIDAIARSIGLEIEEGIESKMIFIVDNKDYIFDDNIPYKEECDKSRQIPDWIPIYQSDKG